MKEFSSLGIVDAAYLDETLPKLFESAVDNLGSQLDQEMDKQLDEQIKQWSSENKNRKVVARGGQRRFRKFESIQNLKKQEFLD